MAVGALFIQDIISDTRGTGREKDVVNITGLNLHRLVEPA